MILFIFKMEECILSLHFFVMELPAGSEQNEGYALLILHSLCEKHTG